MIINQIKTFLLLAILTGVLLFIGSLFGSKGLIIAIVIVFLMNFISYWYSDKIILSIYRAKKIDKKQNQRVYNIVKNVSKKAGLPIPKIYLINTETPNAFATGRNYKNSAIALTKGIINLLNDEEIEGVVAHEMSHIKNRDILIQSIVAVIAGAISYIAYFFRFFAIFGNDRDSGKLISLLLISILAPIIALIIRLAISRAREFMADERGARTTKNPKALADALIKISNGIKRKPMKGPESTSSLFIMNPFRSGFANLFSTHPPVELRVKKLMSLKI